MMLTDNQYRASEDKFLVMAAVSEDFIRNTDKEKVAKAWMNVLKDEDSKNKAEYMQHQ